MSESNTNTEESELETLKKTVNILNHELANHKNMITALQRLRTKSLDTMDDIQQQNTAVIVALNKVRKASEFPEFKQA